METIEHPPIFQLPGVPDHVTYTWLVMLVLIGLTLLATHSIQRIPRGTQNAMEMILEQFLALLDDVVGHEGRRYLPLIATLGLFILASNLLGLVPGMVTPTGNLNTTAACALIVFFAYHWIGIRKNGFWPYLKHFAGPLVYTRVFALRVLDLSFKLFLLPIYFVIEVFSHVARVLSLSVRLFGNMTGGHILLAVIFFLMGLDGLIGWVGSGSPWGVLVGGPASLIMILFTVGFLFPLKILVALLQAFIFVMLSMVYIAGAIEEAEHH